MAKNIDSTSLPTFLAFDPFPSHHDGRPISVTTSGTGATSENDADWRSAKERQSTIPSVTGPAGEPGLPPSRPVSGHVSSNVSSNAKASANIGRAGALSPPPSRSGLLAFAAGRSNSSRSNRGAVNGTTRPASPASKTHVPSLTSQGFFRPMTSQQLQQQRGPRPSSALPHQRGDSVEEGNERGKKQHRYSDASINTNRERLPTRDGDIPPVPASRGTYFSADGMDQLDRISHEPQTANSITTQNSTAPLQGRKSPEGLNLRANGLSPIPQAEKSPRSTRSIRASLGLSSRRATQQQLPSSPSSPVDGSLGKERIRPAGIDESKFQRDVKNYEYFAGNMLFFLAGRCMNTRARPLNVATWILVVLPAALFFGFSAPYLWHHLSPAVPIVFAYVFILTTSSFYHAAFSDPGTLPRNLHPHPPNDAENDPLTPGPATTDWVVVRTYTKKNAGQPIEVPTKYCKTCNIWRPPRAHHCRNCGSCVETQDHHCVWLNNCVGRRNYKFFFAFVGWSSVLALMLLAFSATHIARYADNHNISFGQSLSGRTQERVAFAMLLYSILALPYPGSLLGYHIFLISRGETTREYLNSHKFSPQDRHRPFEQGSLLRNWLAVLTRPRTPSYLQFKKGYRDGDQRLGYDKARKERKKDHGAYSVEMNNIRP